MQNGSVKLLDLGLASVFQSVGDQESLNRVGSMDYASPEQFSEGGTFDQRSLVYSVGAILYHVLTRRNPAQSPFALDPVEEINPSISPAVEEIVNRCTEIEPRDRYATLTELKKSIQAALKTPGAPPPRKGSKAQLWETGQLDEEDHNDSSMWNWMLGVVLMVLMSGALIAIYYFFFRP
jgi:serine/threonine protein kinase